MILISIALQACSSAASNNDGGTGGGSGGGGGFTPIDAGMPSDPCAPAFAKTLFHEVIADSAWHTVEVAPAQGMAGILSAIEGASAQASTPVRIRLAPGEYAPTAAGVGSLYVFNVRRTATAPLLIQAMDTAPDATRLTQGFNFVHVSYIAIDGVTIGPKTPGAYHANGDCGIDGNCFHDAPKPLISEAGVHVSGIAENPSGQGQQNGHLDFGVYGRYVPSHHIVVSRTTIQNVFDDVEPSGAQAAGAGSDGIKFNQASDVYVLETNIRQTSRHGIDTVAVHGGCYLGNTITDTGLGLGVEAKGGSINVVFDGNVFSNIRRVELGGENTDATFYWSAETPATTEHYAYEGRFVVARNNIIIDSREGALEFSGCHDCSAVNNTVFFSTAFSSANGGDAVREVDSMINRDGAGSECIDAQGDGVTDCWHVGPYPADLVQAQGENGMSRPLTNARNSLENNVFISKTALWGDQLNPFNHPNSSHSRGLTAVDYNFWWNGGQAMNDPNDGTWLPKGSHSFTAGNTPDPLLPTTETFSRTTLVAFREAVLTAFTPATGNPLIAKGAAAAQRAPNLDAKRRPRAATPTLGAVE